MHHQRIRPGKSLMRFKIWQALTERQHRLPQPSTKYKGNYSTPTHSEWTKL
jgi:hypothetical protein